MEVATNEHVENEMVEEEKVQPNNFEEMGDSLRNPKERDSNKLVVEKPADQLGAVQSLNKSSDRLSVDRKTTCPFLLRVFVSIGRHHQPADFSPTSLPDGEFQIYTWKDASLKEIASLIQGVFPPARKTNSTLSFRTVFRNSSNGEFLMRNVGVVKASEIESLSDDVTTQLGNIRFHIGDFLDVAVQTRPYKYSSNMNRKVEIR